MNKIKNFRISLQCFSFRRYNTRKPWGAGKRWFK